MASHSFINDSRQKEYLDKLISGEVNDRNGEGSFWDTIPNTGGGICSTMYDLVRYDNAFVYGGRFENARILGRKSVEKICTEKNSVSPL